jgi:hypothetical protein
MSDWSNKEATRFASAMMAAESGAGRLLAGVSGFSPVSFRSIHRFQRDTLFSRLH